MGRIIVFTSGKGGVGKTTVCAGVGAAIAVTGKYVVMVDADIGLNNLDMLMGIENKVTYDMIDVMEGKCRLKQAIINDMYIPTLSVLPSSHAFNSNAVSTENFRKLVNKLSEYYDYVFIDCPAGIENGFHRAVSTSDEAIIVTTPHTSAIRDADKVISLLSGYEKSIIGMIINRMRGDLILRGEMIGVNEMGRLLKCRILGVVPDDDDLVLYSQLGRILELDTKAGLSFRMIARNILTGSKHIYDCTEEYRGFLGKIRMRVRRDS
ncbi:MAG: septum site-determining protein MinD [Christensenellales bacterium]